MYYHRNLRVQLQDRRNRLYKAVQDTYQTELKYLIAFIERTPYLRGLVQELEAQHPEVDWKVWKETHFADRDFCLPDTESAAAKVCYGIICECAYQDGAAIGYGFTVSSERNSNAALRDVTERAFGNSLDNRYS